MPAGTQTIAYRDDLSRVIGELSDDLLAFSQSLKTASDVVEFIDDSGGRAEKIRKSIDKRLKLLEVTEKAGPLSTFSKAIKTLMEEVARPAASFIERKADDLNGLTYNGNPPPHEGFLKDLKTNLDRAADTLTIVSIELDKAETDLNAHIGTLNSTISAIDAATYTKRTVFGSDEN